MGSIELTIADQAYNLALRIAYGNSKRSVCKNSLDRC